MSGSAEQYRQRAQAAAAAGDLPGARTLLEEALTQFPDDAGLANSAGHFAMQAGEIPTAEVHFARALTLAPGTLEFALNRAIALGRLEHNREAVDLLDRFRTAGSNDPRYCSARASAERALGQLGGAARWYESCLKLAPAHARALHGRARVALERGEADAAARFERALAANPSDAEAWLGLAEALDAAGEAGQARNIAEQLVTQAPHWIEALRFLAQLRLAAGEADFAGHFEAAAVRRPNDPTIALAHIEALGGLDFADQAAEVAASARGRFPCDQRFALYEAVQAGAAGDLDRAEHIFADLRLDSPERWLHEARHRLRQGRHDEAEASLDRAGKAAPWDVSVWALRGCLWRLRGDPRAAWLHEQPGLVQRLELPRAGHVLGAAVALLHRLHDRSALPLGQSLRGGTQTRGVLLSRFEPELAQLQEALMEALERYRTALPPADPSHPLLRHRDAPWRISGSWSVRLSGGGDFHTPHIHPQGIISSALYCDLPDGLGDAPDKAGWLELGRPSSSLGLPSPPLHYVRPEPGLLALFPSTLFHGTRAFGTGRRMTVAFDVALAEPSR